MYKFYNTHTWNVIGFCDSTLQTRLSVDRAFIYIYDNKIYRIGINIIIIRHVEKFNYDPPRWILALWWWPKHNMYMICDVYLYLHRIYTYYLLWPYCY